MFQGTIGILPSPGFNFSRVAPNGNSKRHRGFTLFELIITLVLIGVLVIIAAPRFIGFQGYDARGFFDKLTAAPRYAQMQATASGCSTRFTISSSGYSLEREFPCGSGNFSLPIPHPSRSGAFAGSTPDGVQVQVSGAGSVPFNALGVPQVADPPTVTVSGGGFSQSFRIVPDTGLVEVLP